MSFISSLPKLLNLSQCLPKPILQTNINYFSSITQATQSLVPGGGFTINIRNNYRCFFPRPSERKRIKRHGWWRRLSTPGGKRILMQRLLKGRHVLSH